MHTQTSSHQVRAQSLATGLWLGLLLISAAAGCGDAGGDEGPCIQGETQPCVCAGSEGAQSCLADGTWGECVCGSNNGETDGGDDMQSSGQGSDSDDPWATTGMPGDSGESGDDSSSDSGDNAACDEGYPTLAPGETASLSSAGPGQTTGAFCITIPDDAGLITFGLSGGTCDTGECQFEEVRLFFREGDAPDHTNPDEETSQWSYEVTEGGSGAFMRGVNPGIGYLIVDDGANGFGYSGVSLSVSFAEEAGGEEDSCLRVPELDDFACPPGYPPAAYDCFEAPPPECELGEAGPVFCCPA